MSADRRQLAEQIAEALFVNGFGERADRLVLTVDGPPKRDLGGLSPHGAACFIERALVQANGQDRAALEEIECLTDTGITDPWKTLEQVRARARAALGKEG